MLHVAIGILYWEDGSKNETLYNYGKRKKIQIFACIDD